MFKRGNSSAENNVSPAEPGEAAPKKKNWPLRLGIIFLCVALLVSAAVVLLKTRPMGAENVIEEEWKTPEYLRAKTLTILVAGMDDVPEEDRTDLLTDVLMVCNLDLESKKATIMQIPRDTYVGNIVHYSKINGIYNWGLLDEDGNEIGETGMAPLVETIYDQFKLPIDNYVLVTLDGLEKAVDSLGGIDVTIDQDLTLTDDFTLTAGTHTLDGEMAMLFVRSRNYEDADVMRQNVQRYFMAGLFNKLLSCSTGEIMGVVTSLFDYVETDFTVEEIISLAVEAKGFSGSSISMIRVPGEGVRGYGLYGSDVYSVHKDQLAQLMNEYMRPFTDDVPASELGLIEIRNTDESWDDPNLGTLDNYGG